MPADQAITNARGARSALVGAYAALQSLSYYGGDFVFFGDLPTDNADFTGTFNSYAAADANQFRADNETVQDIWDAIYDGINRVNIILEKVPPLTDLEDQEKNQILGEAHFLRALHYHNLVRLYGDVPLRLTSPQTVEESAEITRSPAADVYTQILADLTEAESLITSTETATQATPGAVDALQARVQLYRGDYAAAIAEADEVIGAGYELAPAYGDLFDAEGQDTPEDIFKVIFNAQSVHQHRFLLHLRGRGRAGRARAVPEHHRLPTTRTMPASPGPSSSTTTT